MIRPMPFWPSLEPCENDTPVQVSTSSAADPPAAAASEPLGASYSALFLTNARSASSSSARSDEAHQRRQQQRVADLDRLRPVDAARAVAAVHQRVGHAHADDRADQRVRRRGRQAQRPGAQVPHDGGDQQREHHREAGARADLQDQLHRQQRDDAEGHRAARDEHAQEVEQARPHHRDLRRQRVGVDHRGHRVGGVVEAVDELEAERDQQRQAQQDERPDGGGGLAAAGVVGGDAVGRVAQADQQQQREDRPGALAGLVVEARAAAAAARVGQRRRSRRWCSWWESLFL